MFQALADNQDFWAERLNLFVAFAPVSRMGDSTAEFFHALEPLIGVF